MGLSHDEVITAWEQIKRILEEVNGATVHCGLHAEEGDREGILSRLGRVWDCRQIVDLLSADALNLRVLAVLAMLIDIGQQLLCLSVGLANGSKCAVFLFIVFKIG